MVSSQAFAQGIIQSGSYGELKIAYNHFMNKVTGYYENYSGWDEETKQPKFSCIFYFEGDIRDGKGKINSFYPKDKSQMISGEIEYMDSGNIRIKLFEEHGGCWNVQHFADDFLNFKMDKKERWIFIKHVDTDKVYFHSNSNSTSIQTTYIVRGDIVYIDRTLNEWAHCIYMGKKKVSGWLLMDDLNE